MPHFTFHSYLPSSAAPADAPRRAATVGFFDGVHRGHRFLIDRLCAEARQRGLQPIVVTFDEHPRQVIKPEGYWPELLTPTPAKLALLKETGLAGCAVLHFTKELAALTSREFMARLLKAELGVDCLVMGYDHRFGSNVGAAYRDYVTEGREVGIEVVRELPFDCGELRVSSSATRRFLSAGNVEMAYSCLGRPYRLEGTVVEGHRKGTLLGWPTANLRPDYDEQIVPGRGVYIASAQLEGFRYRAMVNVGHRPTLANGNDQTIEAHLLDYEGGDLYGLPLAIDFHRRLRNELRFASITDLQAQLARDADAVNDYFTSHTL